MLNNKEQKQIKRWETQYVGDVERKRTTERISGLKPAMICLRQFINSCKNTNTCSKLYWPICSLARNTLILYIFTFICIFACLTLAFTTIYIIKLIKYLVLMIKS